MAAGSTDLISTLPLVVPPPPAMPPPPVGRVALYLHRARLIDSLRLRLRLRSPSSSTPPPPLDDHVVALHAIRAAPTPASALSLFRALPSPAPLPLFHALATRLANPTTLPDLRSLLDSFPLPPPPLVRLRLLAAAGDHPSALSTFASIPTTPRRPAEAHTIVIQLHASAGDHAAAVEAFRTMVREGALPNSCTYTVVIDHLVSAGFVDRALEVFGLLPSLRIRRTTRQYNVLSEALASAGKFDRLRWLVREMADVDGVMPGPQTRAAIAAMREAGHTEGTEDFVEELSPNARIRYAVNDVEGEGESGEEDESSVEGDKDRCRVKEELKPWLDPRELAKALEGWDPKEVAELEVAGIVWTPRLVCKLLRAFRKLGTAWAFFGWVACRPGGFAHDRNTVARMVAIFARAGHVQLVERLLTKVRADGIHLPFATVRLVIDFYGLSNKAGVAVRVFRDAEAICGGPISKPNFMLLTSSLLMTLAKCRRGLAATELLEEMMSTRGVLPDLHTFSGLMEQLAGAGDFKSVHKLFGLMRQCELHPDGYMYSVLIRAYCKRKRAALALRLFDEMRSAGITPDAPTKARLVKSLLKEGKLREAALVEELPAAIDGNLLWTVSAADINKVLGIYSCCFRQPDDGAEN